MTQSAVMDKETIKAAKLQKEKDDLAFEAEQNKGRSGKGTRVTVGYTRGKNTQRIVYEAFDESQKDTLPTTIAEFVELTKIQDEPTIMSYLIDGYNSAQYTNASDPVAEHVDSSWTDDQQKQFRLVVRNYANALGLSIEDAVAQIKPNFVAGLAKLQK